MATHCYAPGRKRLYAYLDADAASVFAIGDFEYELRVPVLFFSNSTTHALAGYTVSGTAPKTH